MDKSEIQPDDHWNQPKGDTGGDPNPTRVATSSKPLVAQPLE
jgi:hypothetical protein